ncbi:MAG TPA: amidohydrolase [Jiangellales bacterium]|nr:amidohydrolase [Jiangellales bacterium]
MPDLMIRGGVLWGRPEPYDLLVADGRIAALGPEASAAAPDADVVDAAGRLVLPGLVDAHCHLDKTLWGMPWVSHLAGDALSDRIRHDRERRSALGVPDVGRMSDLLSTMSAYGTTAVRTHTDVDPDVGLRGVEAVVDVTERMRGRVDVQQVAFPQHGLLTRPGTADLLEAATGLGVEVVGGIDPAGIDGDPVRHLNVVFGLADRHGLMVDIHLHDPGTLGAWELDLVLERTRALDLAGRVAVSHAYAFAELDRARQERTAGAMAEAGVALVTAAVYSFPVPPVRLMAEAGVTLACGHDGIRDLWGPYGTGDMLDRSMHLAYRSTFRRDDDIELALRAATIGGARLLGRPDPGWHIGAPGDLVIVDAGSAAQAVVERPRDRLVVKAGQVVAGGRSWTRP